MSEKIARLDKSVIDMVYPVGAIYMSVNSTNPGNLFGGKWEQIKDRFLLAAGDAYTAGETGGEAQHKLTTSEMPIHNHSVVPHGARGGTNGDYAVNDKYGAMSAADTLDISGGNRFYSRTTSTEGRGQAHNNMPPYLTVYMWRRIA